MTCALINTVTASILAGGRGVVNRQHGWRCGVSIEKAYRDSTLCAAAALAVINGSAAVAGAAQRAGVKIAGMLASSMVACRAALVSSNSASLTFEKKMASRGISISGQWRKYRNHGQPSRKQRHRKCSVRRACRHSSAAKRGEEP